MRTGGTRTDLWGPRQLRGEGCGIPHLAKNERDVGHPASVAGIKLERTRGFQAASITIFIEVAVGFDAIAIASTASDKGKRCETSLVRS